MTTDSRIRDLVAGASPVTHDEPEISLKKAKKSERVESILLSAIVPVSKQDLVEKLPDVSVKTIEPVFGENGQRKQDNKDRHI